MNRGAFLQLLGREWLPSIPDVHNRLQSEPPAQVADIGCGAGWSSIGIAQSYARVQVEGFNLDEPSVEMARDNAWESGVAKRVTFAARDVGDPELAGRYDLVTAFECIHDMSQPVVVLRAMRQMVKDGGAVIAVDERAGETFTPSGNEIEGLLYGFSVMHCLPASMAEHPSAGTGTVMRPSTLSAYAREAGFREVEILPIDNFFFRFYRLHI